MDKKILRQLLYEEKQLNYWDIDSDDSLYYILFEQLLTIEGYRSSDLDTENRVKKVFNDASFLCTLVYDYYDRPYLSLGDMRVMIMPPLMGNEILSAAARENNRKASCYANVVLCVTYFMLSYSEGTKNDDVKIRRMINEIDTYLRSTPSSNEIYENFYYGVHSTQKDYLIPSSNFNRRPLTFNIIESIDWHEATGGYNFDQIKEIVISISKSDFDKALLLDAIENHVKKSYNAEEFIDLPF